MRFWRKKQKTPLKVPGTQEVTTDKGKIQALDFGADAEQCFAYLKAALRKENLGAACFVAAEAVPALWTLLIKARISGRIWTKDTRINKKQVSLFKPLDEAF